MGIVQVTRRFREAVWSKKDFLWSLAIVAIITLCQTDALLFSFSNKARIAELIILAVVLLVSSARLIKKGGWKVWDSNRQSFAILVLFLACLLLSFFINCSNTFNVHRYLVFAGNLVLSFFIIQTISRDHFLKAFLFVLFFLTAYSVLLFVPYYMNSSVFSSFPAIVNSAGHKFNWVGFAFFLNMDRPHLSTRNWGWFREPGVFGVFLVAALMISVFYGDRLIKDRRVRWLMNAVFCGGVITTFSTTTIIATFLLLVFCLLRAKSQKKTVIFIKTVSILFLISGFLLLILAPDFCRKIGLGSLVAVFQKISSGSVSLTSRLFDQWAPWFFFAQNPLFGMGFGSFHDGMIALAFSLGFSSNGGINSFAQMFGVFGFVFGSLCLVGTYRFLESLGPMDRKTNIFSFFLLFLCVANEDLTNSLFFFLAILGGLSSRKQSSLFGHKRRVNGVFSYYEI